MFPLEGLAQGVDLDAGEVLRVRLASAGCKKASEDLEESLAQVEDSPKVVGRHMAYPGIQVLVGNHMDRSAGWAEDHRGSQTVAAEGSWEVAVVVVAAADADLGWAHAVEAELAESE